MAQPQQPLNDSEVSQTNLLKCTCTTQNYIIAFSSESQEMVMIEKKLGRNVLSRIPDLTYLELL